MSIEHRFELTDGGKMLAVTVAGMFFHAFFKTISRNKLEKLLEDAIAERLCPAIDELWNAIPTLDIVFKNQPPKPAMVSRADSIRVSFRC